ncbi:MAG: hypothetical protein WC693_02490 [Patescibacteria group bacterium]|jgi:hypothetical protein
MKKTAGTILFIIIFVVFGLGIYYIISNPKPNSQYIADENNNSNVKNSYLIYALTDETSNSVNIVRYNSDTEEKKDIYTIPYQEEGNASPLFFKYNDDHILIYRASSEDKNIIIDVNGNVDEGLYIPEFDSFLTSPSGKFLAYNKEYSNNGTTEYYFTVRDLQTGEESSKPNGINEQMPLIMNPIMWSVDENTIYAVPQLQTDWYPTGLLSINRNSLAIERNTAADDESLIQISMDDLFNIYGISTQGYDPYTDKFSKEIINISSVDNSVKKFPLSNSQVTILQQASPNGNYIPYNYSSDGQLSELWVYDKIKAEEIRITENSVIAGNIYWNQNLLAFFDYHSSQSSNGVSNNYVKIYNAEDGKSSIISEAIRNDNAQLIGWFR